jgi:UDP-3-O-[3-hydroxymyristoyl] glucosamine N-acyltransferase
VSLEPGRGEYTLGEIADWVGGTVVGSPATPIRAVAGIEEAGPGELTFLANPKYRAWLAKTRAGAVLLAPGIEARDDLAVVRTENPYAALAKVLVLFDPGAPDLPDGVHPQACVASEAEIAADAAIGPGVVVGRGASVGARTRLIGNSTIGESASVGGDCLLYPGVYVGARCRLGDRVIVQPGAIIGADGFGYAPSEGGYRKIPQIGIVIVEDDVEIGANACIDRATVGATRIGRGTKIDNLVQVAHNVAIGPGSALAAQAGVAGSTRLGKGVRLGGQAGLVGHLRVGDGASVGAQAGVIGDVAAGETVSGYPARPHREAMRVEAAMRRLPELVRRLKRLVGATPEDQKGQDES